MADIVYKMYRDDSGWGVHPSNLKSFIVKNANKSAKIMIVPPDDTVIENQLICKVKGIIVLRKKDSRPGNIYDGEKILHLVGKDMHKHETAENAYIDKNLENGIKYFYQAFPYSDHNVYNLSEENSGWVIPSDNAPIWGFYQNFDNKSPLQDGSGTISYPSEVQNSHFRPMLTNIDAGTPTMGDWKEFLENVLENQPHIVDRVTGESLGQINSENYNLLIDGKNSELEKQTYVGAWINKIYMKEEYTATGRKVYFAKDNWHINTKDFVPLGFYNKEGKEMEGLWIPMFYIDNENCVKPGKPQLINKNTEQEYETVNLFSHRAVFFGGPIIRVLRDLEYMLFRSTDIQKYAGYGLSGNSSGYPPNMIVNEGMSGFYGTNKNRIKQNKMFHSNVIGTYRSFLRDPYTLIINDKLYLSDKYHYDLKGNGYDVENDIKILHHGYWYPRKMIKTKKNGSIPDLSENEGTSNTGLCDGVAVSNNTVGEVMGWADGNEANGPALINLGEAGTAANWTKVPGVLLLPDPGYKPAKNKKM